MIIRFPDLAVGDVVRLKRQHPCGGWEWRVFRVGADVGIECLGCGRRLLMPRHRFDSRVKQRVPVGSGDGS